MAEIAAGFLGPVIEIVKWGAKPIIRQFSFLCFTSNINSLKNEAKKLDDATEGLQGEVDRAKDNVQVIVPQVKTWLTNSNNIKDEITEILSEATNVESGCLKFGGRFSLSKRAKEMTDRTKELRGQKNFDAISQPGPPAATQAVPGGKTYEFVSRKKIEEDIMATLKDGDVNLIGIYGMGGLGKTTMAEKIRNRVLNENVFQEVAMTVVSQQVDNSKIQTEIGGSLGLKLKGETSQARVQKLHARLSGTKRILLVLDDVWEGLELENLGIPCDYKGCTILITSRNNDALRAMSVQKIFRMEVLSEEDSWFLLGEKAGICLSDTSLNSIAKEILKECRGLPIALITVGAALKDEKDSCIWKDALRQLRQCDQDIPNFIAKVYNPLKLSYDFLHSKQAKSLFLLCCLFREDDDIRLEYLTHFCMGLGIFEGIINLEGARNKMRALTKKLKSRSLLLDNDDEDHVRMHDVVRDVCIFIAKQEGYIGNNDCTWISSSQLVGERNELLTRSSLPNLRLLFLSRRNLVDEEFKFDGAFLEGIKDLYVLCIENYALTWLPHTTQSLINLKTLLLDSCWGLKTISVVQGLVNLEILICRNCHSIKELPPEIKGLNRLKLLELTGCCGLQSIGRGIISSLVGLEELKMLGSFDKWEAKDREERENAALRELEALTNLTCLQIEIKDPALAAENMHLSSKMERFHIQVAAYLHSPKGFDLHHKKMTLQMEGETCLGHWIEMQLLRDTECLYLCGNGAKNVDLAKYQNIRWMKLGKCESTRNIWSSSLIENLELESLPQLQEIWDAPNSSTSFQNLKELKLRDLKALKQFWRSRKNNYAPLFTNLSSIVISYCHSLRNLGQLSIAGKDCLPQLQQLQISQCEMMEHVFSWNGEEEDENKKNGETRNPHLITMKFPKLERVWFEHLPNLTSFYKGIEGIELPLLRVMKIEECPKLKSIIGSSTADIDDDGSLHLFCQPQKVSLGSLKVLEINYNPFCGHKTPSSVFNGLEVVTINKYEGSMSFSALSMAVNLVSLRKLCISNCDEMIKVIEDEAVASGGERILLFPKLEKLMLIDLPKLVGFCGWKCDVELPLLREVEITCCPNMKIFSLGSVAAPKMIKINYEYIGATKDLNGALQQYSAREKEKHVRRSFNKKKIKKMKMKKKKGSEEDQLIVQQLI